VKYCANLCIKRWTSIDESSDGESHGEGHLVGSVRYEWYVDFRDFVVFLVCFDVQYPFYYEMGMFGSDLSRGAEVGALARGRG
jgi:hypothetical protein